MSKIATISKPGLDAMKKIPAKTSSVPGDLTVGDGLLCTYCVYRCNNLMDKPRAFADNDSSLDDRTFTK
jgi:hypothetical protein